MQEIPIFQQYGNTNKSILFTHLCIADKSELPVNMPDLEQILNCVIETEILTAKAINTMKGLSPEGQYLTGKKASIELKLKQKLLYVAEHGKQSVHVVENEFYHNAFIVIPCEIEGTDPEYLLKYNYLRPEVIIEDIDYSRIDKRNIYRNIFIILQLVLVPTYEICYSVHKSYKQSGLFMMYKDGQINTPPEHNLKNKCIKPKWSPHGDKLAFLSNNHGKWMLYMYHLNTGTIKQITDPDSFHSITGFCWSTDGSSLYFTVSDKIKEIFVTDIHRLCYKQLTYGDNVYSSYQPKCSPDGEKIGLIRCISNMADLWIMASDGTDCRQITFDGFVIGFDWSADSTILAYISHIENSNDQISLLNIETNSRYLAESCNCVPCKRKLIYSPDQQYLAFIGRDITTDNIYLYNTVQKTMQNLTEYTATEKISDFCWNCESSTLYYCVNDPDNYNIFSIGLDSNKKNQLTFTTASMMDIDYRPRIG